MITGIYAASILATERLTTAIRRATAAQHDLNRAMAASFLQALKADPGLSRAITKARRRDPDIGWLDVAVHRNRAFTKQLYPEAANFVSLESLTRTSRPW